MKRHLPLLFLLIALFAVIATNLSSKTYLIGWDNLIPELNLSLHIKRSLFAVWEEFHGFGLLGGNGHAAELPRQLILWVFSFALPTHLIRQAYIFLMLVAGSTGTYLLVRTLLAGKKAVGPAACLAGLFYLLNLITVQTFYAPFEPFITQYGLLPWLLYAVIAYVTKPNFHTLLIFTIITIVSIPQGQVPTVFIVYMVALFILLFALNLGRNKTRFVKQSIHIVLMTVILNAFWLLPFLYFSFTNASVAVNAKINQQTTENVFLQNKEFGTLSDVALMKGFWFNNTDPDINQEFSYMMQPWRAWMENPAIIMAGFLLFAIILVGVFLSLLTFRKEKPRNKYTEYLSSPLASLNALQKRALLGFFLLFLLSVVLLLIATPPFSWFNDLLREFVPLFNQVFRFPFTKISILASLSYSVFFGVSVYTISALLHKYPRKAMGANMLIGLLLLLISLPIFSGNLFYAKEKVTIPREYHDLFAHLTTKDPNTRIANFPQPTFWGWVNYEWGYGGSGFLWHGIKQPILDRAFDVWSKTSENYYHEVSLALYAKNPILLENVLKKYRVNRILLDGNVVYLPSPKALFTKELRQLLAGMPSIKKEAQFGKLEVYTVSSEKQTDSFVSTATNLPRVNSYEWNNYDQASLDLGVYRSSSAEMDMYYPFRSLLSNRRQEDIAFTMSLEKQSVKLTQTFPYIKNATLILPSYLTKETIVPIRIFTSKSQNGSLVIYYEVVTPTVLINGKPVWGKQVTEQLFTVPRQNLPGNINSFPLKLDVNGTKTYLITSDAAKDLGTTFASLSQDNTFALSSQTTITQTKIISPSFLKDTLNDLPTSTEIKLSQTNSLEVLMPRIDDNVLSFTPEPSRIDRVENCNKFRNGTYSAVLNSWNGIRGIILEAKNASSCISFYSNELPHDQAYAVFTKTTHIRGKSLNFWVENIDEKYPSIDTVLSKSTTPTTSRFILPPQDQFGKAYSFHFDNTSIGNDETENLVSLVSVYPLAYNFLSGIVIANPEQLETTLRSNQEQSLDPRFMVSHPNESIYILKELEQNSQKQTTVVLSQSYDPDWHAYLLPDNTSFPIKELSLAFPFFFGTPITDHFQVSNWENGWTLLDVPLKEKQVIIVYLPQYLEYAGFVLFGGTFLFLIIYAVRSHARSKIVV